MAGGKIVNGRFREKGGINPGNSIDFAAIVAV
jgi:hypothetical protein